MNASIPLSRRERTLCVAFLGLILLALLGPAIPSEAVAFGNFADDRHWHGIPNAMDVFSNLPFAALGAWGLWKLRRFDTAAQAAASQELPGSTLDCAWMFFAGLLVTAAGSAFFHLQPDGIRLAADRVGMTVVFAGMLGMAVCDRVSQRAGWAVAWCTLAGGLMAVACSTEANNLLPWGVVQFGGMAVVLGLAPLLPVHAGARGAGLRLGWVIAIYAAAKALEAGDHVIYELTGHFVSGHSLKHIVAALAALPVMQALHAVSRRALRHNPDAAAATA